jgi:proline iminopeptidase
MVRDDNTFSEEYIDVGEGHSLYTQRWGNQNSSRKIVFAHGGPGSGTSERVKTLFDPSYVDVLFFDQRGCGNSSLHGEVKDNTTQNLVSDIDTLTNAHNFESFELVGGSWGSCLSLAYAIESPKRVSRMVLWGIFTGRRSEIDFVDKGGIATFFPDIWDAYRQSVPDEYRDDPSSYHRQRILGGIASEVIKSALVYSNLEGAISSLDDRFVPDIEEGFDAARTVIESHYLANDCFLSGDYIIENAGRITCPVTLIQGRHDMVCPPETAYELMRSLPLGRLVMTQAGHSTFDRANWQTIKEANA